MKNKNVLTIKSFTLAEVLIVVAIIGVTAAMTVPTLINKTRNAGFKSAIKKDYSVFSNATNLVLLNDYGGSFSDMTSDGVDNVFQNYLKYLSAVKCSTNDTCPLSVYPRAEIYSNFYFIQANYKTLNGNMLSGTGISDRAVVLNDGTYAIIDKCDDVYLITVDVNGWSKKPNKAGVDFFRFQLVNGRLLPQGADNTLWAGSTEYCSQTSSSPQNGLGCSIKALNDSDWFENLR